MATAKQKAANKRNAQKSTGPRTEQGKAAVAGNAIKHGFYARVLYTSPESQAELHAITEELTAEHKPETPTEIAIIQHLALAQLRFLRYSQFETNLICSDHCDLKDLTTTDRIINAAQRMFYKALREFRAAREARLSADASREASSETIENETETPKMALNCQIASADVATIVPDSLNDTDAVQTNNQEGRIAPEATVVTSTLRDIS